MCSTTNRSDVLKGFICRATLL